MWPEYEIYPKWEVHSPLSLNDLLFRQRGKFILFYFCTVKYDFHFESEYSVVDELW
jgi:hypothetical protein